METHRLPITTHIMCCTHLEDEVEGGAHRLLEGLRRECEALERRELERAGGVGVVARRAHRHLGQRAVPVLLREGPIRRHGLAHHAQPVLELLLCLPDRLLGFPLLGDLRLTQALAFCRPEQKKRRQKRLAHNFLGFFGVVNGDQVAHFLGREGEVEGLRQGGGKHRVVEGVGLERRECVAADLVVLFGCGGEFGHGRLHVRCGACGGAL